jgi:hypothetical protein
MFNWFKSLLKDTRAHELEVLRLQNEHELEMAAARGEYEYQSSICQSCETLKSQLSEANRLIRDLTIKPETREVEDDKPRGNPKPIQSGYKPWSVRRAELEAADRIKAQQLVAEKEKPITVDNLDSVIAKVFQSAADESRADARNS